MLSIDQSAQVEYTINNADQELGYNINNIRNDPCWTTLFQSCSWAMTKPISVKLHCCHCHCQSWRKGWEYMSRCWLLLESGGLTCCRCASIMLPSSIANWIIIISYGNTMESLMVFRDILWQGVITVTIPTPIHTILTCLHHSQVIRTIPEPLGQILNSLIPPLILLTSYQCMSV